MEARCSFTFWERKGLGEMLRAVRNSREDEERGRKSARVSGCPELEV